MQKKWLKSIYALENPLSILIQCKGNDDIFIIIETVSVEKCIKNIYLKIYNYP